MLGPAALLPLMARPEAALALAGAAAAIALAFRSVAYPLALGGLPAVVFALIGSNPFPSGAVTVAISAWIALALFFAVVRGRGIPAPQALFAAPVVISLALLAWMLLRLDASAAPEYGTVKTELFVAGNVLFMVAGVFVAWRPRTLQLFLILWLAVALAAAVLLVVQLVQGTAQSPLPSRFAISTEEDPISLGRSYAAGLIIAISMVLGAMAAPVRLVALASIPVFALTLFASGSRGPIVAALFGIAALAALTVASASARRRMLLAGLGLLVAVLLAPPLLPDTTISRSLSFLTTDVNLSSNGRTQLWGEAYREFADKPLVGIGTGGFDAVRAEDHYPHNILLEAATELGLVGLALMAAFVAASSALAADAWRRLRGTERHTLVAVLALLVTAFVGANFSGDLTHNRAVWLWVGVLVGMARHSARVSQPERAAIAHHPAAA